jgi:hypothetical protein
VGNTRDVSEDIIATNRLVGQHCVGKGLAIWQVATCRRRFAGGLGEVSEMELLRRGGSKNVHPERSSTGRPAVRDGSSGMNRWRRWKLRNSTLWRIAAAFWMLNAVFNGVTASVARTPSVYLALGGINVFLAGLSYFVSNQYRWAEQSLRNNPDATSRSGESTVLAASQTAGNSLKARG